jgi:protein phosphatase
MGLGGTLKERWRVPAESLKGVSTEAETALEAGIVAANERILQEQLDDPSMRGMGTTLSALWMVPDDSLQSWIVHIGDSRIYRLRDGVLIQITEDHSPVFRLHKQGVLTKDQILEHPQKNLLDRSLGILSTTQPDIFQTDVRLDDLFLICTDGLTDMLKDGEIEQILKDIPFEAIALALVEEAKSRGGFDNITLALFEITEIELSSRPELTTTL